VAFRKNPDITEARIYFSTLDLDLRRKSPSTELDVFITGAVSGMHGGVRESSLAQVFREASRYSTQRIFRKQVVNNLESNNFLSFPGMSGC